MSTNWLKEEILKMRGATEFAKEWQIRLTADIVRKREALKLLEIKTKEIAKQELPEHQETLKLLLLFFETADAYYNVLEDNSYDFSDEAFDKEWGSRVVSPDF